MAEEAPWRWFKSVVRERRKREVEPIIEAFGDTLSLLGPGRNGPLPAAEAAERAALSQRLQQMLGFVVAFNKGIDFFLHFSREDLTELIELLEVTDHPGELVRELIEQR